MAVDLRCDRISRLTRPRPLGRSAAAPDLFADLELAEAGSVLITGGAGFLGRFLAEALALAGVPVTVLDDLSCRNSSFDCPELRHSLIHCVRGSVRERDLLASLVDTHRTVAHLACIVGVEETISRTMATVENLGGTLHLARALTADHVVLYTSSADVYGAISHFRPGPMQEGDYFVFESGSVNRWVYPHVKALEENLLSQTPARAVQIRVFNTYGPAMDYPDPKRVVPHFLDAVFRGKPLRLSGDGRQTRSFCHVDDQIRGLGLALAYALASDPGNCDVFNLGFPEPVSIRDLAERIASIAIDLGLAEAPVPILPDSFDYSQAFDDRWHRVPDISKARRLLGFEPRIGLDEGLRWMLEYYGELIMSAPSKLR